MIPHPSNQPRFEKTLHCWVQLWVIALELKGTVSLRLKQNEQFLELKLRIHWLLIRTIRILKNKTLRIWPPPSPPPRKKKLLEKRIRGVHEKKRLFHDDEYEDEEDEDENVKTGKIIQEEFSENQIREIEKECATDAKSNETKNFTSLSYEGPAKYKKVEADVGRCMFAYYTQTNEDKLASFNPIWVNVGPPNVAKEMVCLR